MIVPVILACMMTSSQCVDGYIKLSERIEATITSCSKNYFLPPRAEPFSCEGFNKKKERTVVYKGLISCRGLK